jgi:hypothetical protein
LLDLEELGLDPPFPFPLLDFEELGLDPPFPFPLLLDLE